MDNLTALLRERAAKVAEMRSMVEAAETRGEVTSEDQQSIDRISEEIRGLDGRIANLQSLASFEGAAPEGVRSVEVENVDPESAEREYRDAFVAMIRGDASVDQLRSLRNGYVAEEARDQTLGVAAKGGYLAPVSFVMSMRKRIEEFSIIRPHVETLRTGDGRSITFTDEDARGAAAWMSEGAPFPVSDDTFKQTTIDAWKAGRLTKMTLELVEDSEIDIEAYLANSVGESLAELEDAAIVNGDGTAKPRGFMLDADVGATIPLNFAAGGAAAADLLIDLTYSVRQAFRRNGRFIVSDLAVRDLRKIKDADGRWIWQEGSRVGEPTSLLGYPVDTEKNMPTPGASAKPIAFGDFKRYLFREVNGVRVAVLRERYLADEGKIGVLAWHRVDGGLLDTTAVKVAQQAAS